MNSRNIKDELGGGVCRLETKVSVKNANKTMDQHSPSPAARQSEMQNTFERRGLETVGQMFYKSVSEMSVGNMRGNS